MSPPPECKLCEEGDLVCIVHCSIPSIEHKVLLPSVLKALPTLSSTYLIPFLLNSIRISELLELFKLILLSRLLYFQFFNLANTYLSPLKYVGPALLFVCVSSGFTKGWQIEMSLSVDLYQIVEFFLVFIFYL